MYILSNIVLKLNITDYNKINSNKAINRQSLFSEKDRNEVFPIIMELCYGNRFFPKIKTYNCTSLIDYSVRYILIWVIY